MPSWDKKAFFMQEAIGPSIVGPAVMGTGSSLTDGPCGYSCGIGSQAFEQMLGNGLSKNEAIKAQAKELAYAQTELIEQIPISVYQLKAQKARFVDKVTGEVREEKTLVSPEFGEISKFTDAGEHGTGTTDSYSKIVNRAHELANARGPVSMLWISPGEPVNRDDGKFIPEHRAYVWKKDNEGNVNAYQYLLTGTPNSLLKMISKLGFQGKEISLADQVVVRNDNDAELTHAEVFSAFESSLTSKEKNVYEPFINNFRIDVRIPDEVRINKINNYQDVFAEELKKEFDRNNEDMQNALKHIVHGFMAIIQELGEKNDQIQNQQGQQEYKPPPTDKRWEIVNPSHIISMTTGVVAEVKIQKTEKNQANDAVLTVYERKKKKQKEIIPVPEIEEEKFTPLSEKEIEELRVFEEFTNNNDEYREFKKAIKTTRETEESTDTLITGLAILQITDNLSAENKLKSFSAQETDNKLIRETLLVPAVTNIIEQIITAEEMGKDEVSIEEIRDSQAISEKAETEDFIKQAELLIVSLTLHQIDDIQDEHLDKDVQAVQEPFLVPATIRVIEHMITEDKNETDKIPVEIMAVMEIGLTLLQPDLANHESEIEKESNNYETVKEIFLVPALLYIWENIDLSVQNESGQLSVHENSVKNERVLEEQKNIDFIGAFFEEDNNSPKGVLQNEQAVSEKAALLISFLGNIVKDIQENEKKTPPADKGKKENQNAVKKVLEIGKIILYRKTDKPELNQNLEVLVKILEQKKLNENIKLYVAALLYNSLVNIYKEKMAPHGLTFADRSNTLPGRISRTIPKHVGTGTGVKLRCSIFRNGEISPSILIGILRSLLNHQKIEIAPNWKAGMIYNWVVPVKKQKKQSGIIFDYYLSALETEGQFVTE